MIPDDDTMKLFKQRGFNYCHASRRVLFFFVVVFLCMPFASHAAQHVPAKVYVVASNQQPAGFSNSPDIATSLNIFQTSLSVLQVTLEAIAIFVTVFIGLGIWNAYTFSKKKKEVDNMISKLSEQIENVKDASAEAWNLTGLSFHARGSNLSTTGEDGSEKYRKALGCYDKALELRPKFVTLLYNRACTYSRLKEKRNALNDLSKAIELDGSLKMKALEDEDNDFENLKTDEDFKNLTDL